MRSLIRSLLIYGAMFAIVAWLAPISHGAGPYYVGFNSVTMSPAIATAGARVTFTITVENAGPARIYPVQIRIIQPADTNCRGMVQIDVPNQAINLGLNTYQISSTFNQPTATQKGLCIVLYDRSVNTTPLTVIKQSPYLDLPAATCCWKLEPYKAIK